MVEPCHYCDRATYWRIRDTDGSVIPVCDWHATSRLPLTVRVRSFDHARRVPPSGTLQVMLPPQPDCGGLLAEDMAQGADGARVNASAPSAPVRPVPAPRRRRASKQSSALQGLSDICWSCGKPYDADGDCDECFY